MQAAFLAHDAFQCGYCTPGQIASAKAVIDEIGAGIPSHATDDLTARIELTDAEIRERMSGNICRCGAYANILAAITEAAESHTRPHHDREEKWPMRAFSYEKGHGPGRRRRPRRRS